MKIVAAAIKFRQIENEEFEVWTGRRHAEIFDFMHSNGIKYDKTSAIQGFVTDTNEFVNRYEAKKIAVAANQLIVPESSTHAELFSEDVW